MGNFYPMTSAQSAAHDVFMSDLHLLDEQFDEELDFHDEHVVALEVNNQFTTHTF